MSTWVTWWTLPQRSHRPHRLAPEAHQLANHLRVTCPNRSCSTDEYRSLSAATPPTANRLTDLHQVLSVPLCCRSESSARGRRTTTSSLSRRGSRTTTRAQARRPDVGPARPRASSGCKARSTEAGCRRRSPAPTHPPPPPPPRSAGAPPAPASTPATAAPLAAQRGGSRVPGFDLTFRPPKSVSVLFGLAGSEISGEVRDAHEAAVESALDCMERLAAVGRRGHGGIESVPGNGFLAAAFRHRTSRAGDPQLHTHVLVANITRGPDERWTALDGRKLYAHAKTGGYLYQAALRRELVRRLGVEWGPVHNGTAEVAGIPQPVLRAFSRRRAEIERTMAERGEHSQRAAQVAALDTRQAKDYGVSAESLRGRWRAQASRLGLEREQLSKLTGRAVVREPARAEAEEAASLLASPHGLTRDRASFTRRDVIQAWCEGLPQGAEVATIESLADEFLASEHSVPLATDVRGLTHRDVIRRADGQVITATAEERRHSTPELLAIEKRLIEGALSRRGDGSGVVPEAAVEAALRRRPTLGGEQAEMVRRLTREGHGVQIVTGKAGTGKTFALDAAREAWQSRGHNVIGAAVARRAARELEDGAGIESTSLAALLQDLRAGAEHDLPPHAVVVVDEASMAGTRDLAELLEYADSAQAKVVLVGDPHQLPEIDAGGALPALITRTDPNQPQKNPPQREAWEGDALHHPREGNA